MILLSIVHYYKAKHLVPDAIIINDDSLLVARDASLWQDPLERLADTLEHSVHSAAADALETDEPNSVRNESYSTAIKNTPMMTRIQSLERVINAVQQMIEMESNVNEVGGFVK